MATLLWILSTLLVSALPVLCTPNKCVMRGCGQSAPCVYDGPPEPLGDGSALATLQEVCPDLKIDSTSPLCCTSDQVVSMAEQLGMMSALFKECPSCVSNAVKPFCAMTCSPDQSDFIKVTSNEDKTVKSINYYISEDFITKDYDSCKNVLLRSSTTKAMALACGSFGDKCNPRNWFYFMGHNPFSPIVIDFQYSDTPTVDVDGQTFKVMNEPTTPCNPEDGPDSKCGCQ